MTSSDRLTIGDHSIPVVVLEAMPRGTIAAVSRCGNCEGKGHEGAGLLEDDYPCRTCKGAGFTAACVTGIERAPHSQECEDHALCHHAATGGDAECICGADRQ